MKQSFALRILPYPVRSWIARSETLRRFLKIASWTMIAFALDKAAQTVVIVFLANVLGAADYGRLTLTQGFVNSTQLFIVLGASSVLARYIPAMLEESFARAVEIINLCALTILSTAGVLTLAGIAGAPFLATFVLELPASSPIPYWIVAWILLTAVNGLLLTIMLSFEKGRAMGEVSLIGALISIVAVPLSAMHAGFYGAAIALVAVEAAKATLLIVHYLRLLSAEGVSPLTPARRSDAPLLLTFGIPVFLSSALWAPTMWLAQIMLKQFSPGGLASVGVFGFCNNVLGIVILFSTITNRASLPIMSSLKTRGDHGAVRKFTASIVSIQMLSALVVGLPLVIFSPYIMSQFGPEFFSERLALVVMVTAGVFISGQQPLVNVLLINDRPITNLAGMAAWSMSLLVITYLTVEIGALAVAYAVLASSILRGLFLVVAASRDLRRRSR